MVDSCYVVEDLKAFILKLVYGFNEKGSFEFPALKKVVSISDSST